MNACSSPIHSQITGEPMCTAGAYPEDGDWEQKRSQCRSGAERDEERSEDMKREEV